MEIDFPSLRTLPRNKIKNLFLSYFLQYLPYMSYKVASLLTYTNKFSTSARERKSLILKFMEKYPYIIITQMT